MNGNNNPPSDPSPVPGTEDGEAVELVDRLRQGRLSREEQVRLAELLESAPSGEMQLIAAMRRESFSGPLPHPDVLNQYEEQARAVILSMAQEEQAHTHRIQESGLTGAIRKDRRGQWIGGAIAITGLVVAAIIAPHSVVAAGVIGALELFGMVALFGAPRLMEGNRGSNNGPAGE